MTARTAFILAFALGTISAGPTLAQNASPDLTQFCRDSMSGNMTGGWSKRKKGWYCFINGRDDQFSKAINLDEACRKQFPDSTGSGSRVPGTGLDPVPVCKGTSASDRPRSGSSVAGGQSPDLGAWCRSKNSKATDAVFKGNTWHCIFGRYVQGQGFGADVAAACAQQFPGSRPVKSGQDSQGRTRWICKTDGEPITSSNTGGAAQVKNCPQGLKKMDATQRAGMEETAKLCRSGRAHIPGASAAQIRDICKSAEFALRCR